ncbi:MAG: insulinase family protein [Lachnospiraceae bacterium]|nr:insulinase family protein [Lachnospiraceae bacterium]
MSRNVKNSGELGALPAYRLEYEEYVPDCKGQGMVFRHIRSGARVCVISNDDENKVFMISFRTNPTDDTGVPHITEHSVLCGSDKFPPKDPFMELAKGSLNTFLNAFTYPDKTCYPVASCNDKDFNNLMDVYMDAVLHPNIYKHEEIFKQEGWHYEIASKDDPITINGVVYSEMKGAFGNAEDRLERSVFSALYPDNTYGVESGGDPKSIPDLTYKQFLDFHSKFYHPTNSYIYIYGNMDVEDRLEWLDEAYLKEYDVQPVDSEVKTQQPIGTKEIHSFYPLEEDAPEEDAGFLAWAFMFSNYDDTLKNAAMSVLTDVLFNVSGAPVKEALVKAGIGKDVSSYLSSSLKQPMVMTVVRNTEADKLSEMKKVILDTLKKIADEGINKNSLLAAINGNEFQYCEADFGGFPKGLEYGVIALTTWLYNDSEAFTRLHQTELFPKLRELIEKGYYEDLIRDYMLNADSQVFSAIAPKKGLGAEEEKKLADRLAAMKAAMSDEEIEKLVADTLALKTYQSEGSTPEDLATLPLLERKDLRREITPYINEETEISGIPTLFHETDTNGIVYLKLLFNASMLNADELFCASLGLGLMGDMDTADYSYLELNNQINIHTGGIGNDMSGYNVRALGNEPEKYKTYVSVSGKVLSHSFGKMTELMAEEMLRTDYSSLTRVRELLAERISRFRYTLSASGHATAIHRAGSYISSSERIYDISAGYSSYKTICQLAEMSDDELKKEIEKAESVVKKLLVKKALMIDITCTRELLESSREELKKLLDLIPEGEKPAATFGIIFEDDLKNEGFKSSGEVNYVAAVGRFNNMSSRNIAALTILRVILSREYLYNKLRVLGGAYGCGFSFSDLKGTGYFYSYRDPHVRETMDIYRLAADYVANFDTDEREMTKYVIGTMGNIDRPLSPADKGSRSLGAYLSKIDEDERQKIRDAIIDATCEDIRSAADSIREIFETGAVCAVGCESTINANSELFKEVKGLL